MTEQLFYPEHIIKLRGKGQTLQLYIKWRDYDAAHNSWEPIQTFTDDWALLDAYFALHPQQRSDCPAPCLRSGPSLYRTQIT